jgi:hypothetical protein
MAKINSKYWDITTSGWVFLSHSSKDYEEVKVVRDYLEEHSFNALMFYLKCLDHDPTGSETQSLIYREIDARNIFVLCNSEHAENSTWVRDEVSYVKSSINNKVYTELNIDNMKQRKCTELSILDDLINSSTLYLIYGSKDKEIATNISQFLSSEGFKVFVGNQIQKTYITESMIEIKSDSTIIVFVSADSMNSSWYRKLMESVNNQVNIIYIYVGEKIISLHPKKFIGSNYIYIQSKAYVYEERDRLLDILKGRAAEVINENKYKHHNKE